MSLKVKILRILERDDYVPMTQESIAHALKLKPQDASQLNNILSQLVEKGTLVELKNQRYCLASDADLVTGIIRFRSSGAAILLADPLPNGEDRPPLVIQKENTGLALNGDRVVVRIERPKFRYIRPRKGKPAKGAPRDASDDTTVYGCVIRILERINDTMIGTFQKSKNFYYIIPDDPTFPQDVSVGPPEEYKGRIKPAIQDKVIVRLHNWTNRHLSPTGEIIEILGKTHTPSAEFEAVLRKYKLQPQFPAPVIQESEKIPATVPESVVKQRLDIRHHFTFTIDPDDAKDFDDAISIDEVDGFTRIGIHIADVSAYVKQGTHLDKEAQRRGNSTYLVGCVIPMLPHSLSNGICSLVEQEDRLTKSAFITFNKNSSIKDVTFANTVINSNKRLTYKQAYAFLRENDFEKIKLVTPPPSHQTGSTGKPLEDLSNAELKKLQEAIRTAWSIAEVLRKRRFQEGSLDLDIPEVKIYVDAQGFASRIEKSVNDESHQLIEEFMLLANEVVAKALQNAKLPFISRVHDKPDADRLQELGQLLAMAQIPVGDLTNKKAVAKLLELLKTHPHGYTYKIQFLRSLKQACYRAQADGHYGLAKDYYTHFTSPIRRYSDLIVHRIFDRYLANINCPTAPKDNIRLYKASDLNTLSDHLSITERNSTDAERESVKIKLLEFFGREVEKKQKQVFTAIITEVRNHGFFVELTESMAYGFVRTSSLPNDLYSLTRHDMVLQGRRKENSFHVGQEVQVTVEKVDRFKRIIDFDLYNPSTAKNNSSNNHKDNKGSKQGNRDASQNPTASTATKQKLRPKKRNR